jgi:hypothetical protein
LTKLVLGSALVGGAGGFIAGFQVLDYLFLTVCTCMMPLPNKIFLLLQVAAHVYTDDNHREEVNKKLAVGLGVTVTATVCLCVYLRRWL